MKKFFTLLAAMLIVCSASYAKPDHYTLLSPDESLRVEIQLNHTITYSLYSSDHLLLKDCSLSLQLADIRLGLMPKVRKEERGSIDEIINRIVHTKNSTTRNHCNTLTLTFDGGYGVEFRAYDEGVAYRLLLNQKQDVVDILGEECTINFADDFKAHMSTTWKFRTGCEEPYKHTTTKNYGYRDEMAYMPLLLEAPTGEKILFSDANVIDYPRIFLRSTGENGMTSLFPKFPTKLEEEWDRSLKILEEADYIARTSGKRALPWRMFVVAKDDKALLEQELLFCLSDANELEDSSWIRPGKVAWDWWNQWQVYGVDFRAGRNTDTYKYFIDFAAKYGIEYIILDEGWSRTTRDPFHFNPEVNVPELIEYGKSKGVGIILWLVWLTVENNFTLFETFTEWGVAGVKVDFMDRSDQWMVNYYERVAKEAAKHKLLVDFHGSFPPTGLERRYPNVISYEGVLGLEQNERCKPENSIYLPFIRNAVGGMDFTPGAMLSLQPHDNRTTFSVAMASSTRAYQMALYVVFESGIQMLADSPTRYLNEPECTEYIASVPVLWDESVVLDAKVGEYVVIARRSGDKWFVGAITNQFGREIDIDLSFLGEGKYTLTSFEDGINADRVAIDYKKRTTEVDSQSKIHIKMVNNGGWCGVIE
ncbi:MAG: glycoside hydrolase family 97 protein [Alistipes sp.]|nr:glycoside hydrolase family 97 protein [Alistipes sp.]